MKNDIELSPSPLSFAIAAIPNEPIYSEVAKASLTITKYCDNRNIIDNKRWPCHVSLILSGTSHNGLKNLAQMLSSKEFKPVIPATATSLYSGWGGFIGVTIDGKSLTDLHQNILDIVAKVIKDEPSIRPHLLSRWSSLSLDQKAVIRSYGSYQIREKFRPHLSVAQVGDDDLKDMISIAQKLIRVPQEILFNELQIVDVGHNNEKWDIVYRFPLES